MGKEQGEKENHDNAWRDGNSTMKYWSLQMKDETQKDDDYSSTSNRMPQTLPLPKWPPLSNAAILISL